MSNTDDEFDTPDEIKTEAPITISLSLADLAQHLVPGYDSEYGETVGVHALDGLMGAIAATIRKDIKASVVQQAAREANAQVQEAVREIVTGVLNGEVRVVDDYGRTQQSKPLRDMIADEVKSWSSTRTSGSYDSRTNMQKFIKETVEQAIKKELREVLDEERQRFREAVRSIAAATLADDAALRRGR